MLFNVKRTTLFIHNVIQRSHYIRSFPSLSLTAPHNPNIKRHHAVLNHYPNANKHPRHRSPPHHPQHHLSARRHPSTRPMQHLDRAQPSPAHPKFKSHVHPSQHVRQHHAPTHHPQMIQPRPHHHPPARQRRRRTLPPRQRRARQQSAHRLDKLNVTARGQWWLECWREES